MSAVCPPPASAVAALWPALYSRDLRRLRFTRWLRDRGHFAEAVATGITLETEQVCEALLVPIRRRLRDEHAMAAWEDAMRESYLRRLAQVDQIGPGAEAGAEAGGGETA